MSEAATESAPETTEGDATPPVPPEASDADSVAAAPPPPDESLKLARRFEAAKAAEIKARQREAKLRAREAEIEAEVSKAREALRLLNEDPVEALRLAGVEDPAEWVRKAATPKSEEAKELERIKRELRERDERAQAQAKDAAMRQFVSEITADECPALTTLYEPDEIPGLVERALQKHLQPFIVQFGRHPTDREIRDYLESTAKARLERGRGAATPNTATQSSPPVNGAKTLTNDAASAVSSAKTPSKFDRERALRELRERLEAESKHD